MDCKVFYSWQSDLPNKTNRSFIEKALENAIKTIRKDDTIEVEPFIDRDTLGVGGSPDISRTIFEKIETCQIFVCDISIINQGSEFRRTPNPNVLIELGYALKTLGENRICLSKYLNSNKQKRSHFHLDISPELNEKLEELAQKIDGTKTDVLRQGITLLHLMLEAKEQGKKFGIAEPDRDISVEIDL